MELSDNGSTRGRLARTILAVVLTVVAIISLRKGKRLTGALAGVGALALGYSATSETSDLKEALEIDMTSDDDKLRCAACGQPIRPGEGRGPNTNHETVHVTCMELSE